MEFGAEDSAATPAELCQIAVGRGESLIGDS